MSPVEAAVIKSDTSFINTMINNCASRFSSHVSVWKYMMQSIPQTLFLNSTLTERLDSVIGWLFQPKRIHELNAYLHLYFGHLQVWDDLGIYVVVLLCLLGYFFFLCFYTGSDFALRHPCMVPLGFSPFNGNYKYASKGKVLPSGIYSASMCKHNSH